MLTNVLLAYIVQPILCAISIFKAIKSIKLSVAEILKDEVIDDLAQKIKKYSIKGKYLNSRVMGNRETNFVEAYLFFVKALENLTGTYKLNDNSTIEVVL